MPITTAMCSLDDRATQRDQTGALICNVARTDEQASACAGTLTWSTTRGKNQHLSLFLIHSYRVLKNGTCPDQ